MTCSCDLCGLIAHASAPEKDVFFEVRGTPATPTEGPREEAVFQYGSMIEAIAACRGLQGQGWKTARVFRVTLTTRRRVMSIE